MVRGHDQGLWAVRRRRNQFQGVKLKCPHPECESSFCHMRHLRRHETLKHGRLPTRGRNSYHMLHAPIAFPGNHSHCSVVSNFSDSVAWFWWRIQYMYHMSVIEISLYTYSSYTLFLLQLGQMFPMFQQDPHLSMMKRPRSSLEKPHVCFCGRSFYFKHDMRRHQKLKHDGPDSIKWSPS